MYDIQNRLHRLEVSVRANGLAELERANPYLELMRVGWEKMLHSQAGAALWAEFDTLLGPVPRPPASEHVGRDMANALAGLFVAMVDSIHSERLFTLWSALSELHLSYLPNDESVRPENHNAHAG